MTWSGNDQEEIGIAINTNHDAKTLEKLYVCKHKGKAGLWPNILAMFGELQPLCDCLLMLYGDEEAPDFILWLLQWPKQGKGQTKQNKKQHPHTLVKPLHEKEIKA